MPLPFDHFWQNVPSFIIFLYQSIGIFYKLQIVFLK
jgi:hypothetical protein